MLVGFTAGLGGLTVSRGIEMIIGMLIGVSAWWLILVSVVFMFRKRITPTGVHKFSRMGAVILCVVAFIPLLSCLTL